MEVDMVAEIEEDKVADEVADMATDKRNKVYWAEAV